jgi:integrase
VAHLPPADDPAIQTWFSRLDNPHTQKSYGHYFDEWLEYLHRKPGYENVTPAKLIEMQDAATTKIDRYKLLTLLQEYVSTLELAKRTRVQAYTAVRSFFLHNHSELPTDTTYQIKGKKPPAPKNLTTENVHDILKAATLRDRSLLTVKWQSLLDTAGLVYLNENMGEHLANEIKAGHCPILLGNFPGRKSTENEPRGTFYTFISTDSIAALKEYFEKERGWPAKGEPVWKDKLGHPLSYGMMGANYRNLLRRLGLIPKKQSAQSGSSNIGLRKQNVGVRYGFNLHEMRDVAKTDLHKKAKKLGLDMDAIDYVMGHTESLDKNRYDTFFNDRGYMTDQYKIAEPYLNITSNPPIEEQTLSEIEKKLETLEKIASSKTRLETIDAVKEFKAEILANWTRKVETQPELKWGLITPTDILSSVLGARAPPAVIGTLDNILRTLEAENSSPLQVYRAQKEFERIVTPEAKREHGKGESESQGRQKPRRRTRTSRH